MFKFTSNSTNMQKTFILVLLLAFSLNLSFAQSSKTVQKENIARILNTLASDEMRGRSALRPEIAIAADFIANEFKEIGLQPYEHDNYRQSFVINQTNIRQQNILFQGKELAENSFLITGNSASLHWNQDSVVNLLKITAEDNFSLKFRELMQKNPQDAIVLVDKKHAEYVSRFKFIYNRSQTATKEQSKQYNKNKVFIVADSLPEKFDISIQRETKDLPMFNVAGVIPGKSKANEYVIFSAHYDHIGILEAVDQDSIANGADDDASGTTAMIELARYYKELDNNERTLIFVAFTAEEIGMYGSKHFSSQIKADQVTAMINIEMIGKDSKFGPNSLYITGYDASDLGKLMQENLKGTSFTFHPDPYKTQNLFYRSDNAVLAALGVPAHTFSTSQIDNDTYYHTVKDEVSTLDIENIQSSIEAIALGATGIVNGEQTPSRVEKLRD